VAHALRTLPIPVEPDPRPFVKWVGGKRQLIPEILKVLPERFGTYHEPFVGGGALFFHLRPFHAVLSDSNARLVRTYLGVRNRADAVIRHLGELPHDRDFFLDYRRREIDAEPDAAVAAWFIYLNRTAFNGLYRVNRRNVFNVPFGAYTKPRICDADNLHACQWALRGAQLCHEDFTAVLGRARPGDLVYFDPPYVPLSPTSSFTSYTAGGFGLAEQVRLRDVARALKRRGVHVVLSNSSAPLVWELYADGFELTPVAAARNVNCRGDRRGPVMELLIH